MLLLHKLYPKGMSSGRYIAVGDLDEADIFSVHEWGPCERIPGTDKLDPGEANRQLATMVLEQQQKRHRPIVGSITIQEALSQVAGKPMKLDYLINGQASGAFGGGTSTAGEVHTTKVTMDEKGFLLPAFFANAHHIGRVQLHARRQGIVSYVVPIGLPSMFRPESSQRWIQSKGLWIPREIVGAPVAYMQDRQYLNAKRRG